ncbi:MAG: hypothetical protein P8Y01_05050 [Woeseiaceae bacterium]|jgi:hypothetical protein
MSRSPLAYPLVRNADQEIGGAADLQTDVMRFMAILALCLVAIFALVQAIPLAPAPEPAVEAEAFEETEELEAVVPVTVDKPEPVAAAPEPANENVVLTRPKWVPKPGQHEPASREAPPVAPQPAPTPPTPPPPPPPKEHGFTLRFASDSALMRAVAAHDVGVYAIDSGRALRMTVRESRISFWDASTPNAFHEMEANTVPAAVVDALSKSGLAPESVAWGVTLPGRMRGELDALMQEHAGGLLIIGAGGTVHWEASP